MSLGLGLGANSALFNMFNSLLWRPLPVDAPEQVGKIYSRSAKAPFYDDFPWPEYRDYASDRSFDGLAAYTITECALATPGQEAMRIYGEAVSGNYFAVLRPRMQLGRGFHSDEGHAVGRDPIVVIGDRLWQRRFGADPAGVGRGLRLNTHACTVIALAPPHTFTATRAMPCSRLLSPGRMPCGMGASMPFRISPISTKALISSWTTSVFGRSG